MRRQTRIVGIGVAAVSMGLLLFATALANRGVAQTRGQSMDSADRRVNAGEFKISGPYTHKNLSIFLVHGKDKIKGRKFLTLAEALDRKKVTIHETSSVNELIIENGGDIDIYIQAGDIVKGGKQDRVLSFDIIVPPRSGKVRIKAFCVEQGRWRQRGNEAVVQFSSSADHLASKDLKLAVRHKESQQEVWQSVEQVQGKLARNVGGSVRAAASESSLQLSLEDPKVNKAVKRYIKRLSGAIKGHDDVVGYAFAINGKVNSVDVYACHALFKKVWPKLLKATAVEAVADYDKGREFEPATANDVKAFMREAEKGRASEKDVDGRMRLRIRASQRNVLFETRDEENGGLPVRMNYLVY
jgi:hypothetical protein